MKKGKRHFAALDTVLLLTAIITVASVLANMTAGSNGFLSAKENRPSQYSITLHVDNVDGNSANKIFRTGKSVFFESGEIIGTVSEIYTDSVVISCEGITGEAGFMLNETVYLAPNMPISVRCGEKVCNSVISEITDG